MEKDINTKLTETADLFRKLQETACALLENWYDPDIAAVIDESNDSYPFAESFEEVVNNLHGWTCNNCYRIEQAQEDLIRNKHMI